MGGGAGMGFFMVTEQRHLIFATVAMLALMCRASAWFVDATFKVVKAPFVQLFSVHCFIKSGKTTKQVPVAFILMSGRRTEDYAGVLRVLLELMPAQPAVAKITADFEAAMWQGVRQVFPEMEMKGCLFHFTQKPA